MTGDDVRLNWARLGARARLAEIERERTEILQAFPELARRAKAGKPGRTAPSVERKRRAREMTPAWRAKLGVAAKRRWAEAKKAGRTRL